MVAIQSNRSGSTALPAYFPPQCYEVTRRTVVTDTGSHEETTVRLIGDGAEWLTGVARCTLLEAVRRGILRLPPEIKSLSSAWPDDAL